MIGLVNDAVTSSIPQIPIVQVAVIYRPLNAIPGVIEPEAVTLTATKNVIPIGGANKLAGRLIAILFCPYGPAVATMPPADVRVAIVDPIPLFLLNAENPVILAAIGGPPR